jgi:hypothetical protein
LLVNPERRPEDGAPRQTRTNGKIARLDFREIQLCCFPVSTSIPTRLPDSSWSRSRRR